MCILPVSTVPFCIPLFRFFPDWIQSLLPHFPNEHPSLLDKLMERITFALSFPFFTVILPTPVGNR